MNLDFGWIYSTEYINMLRKSLLIQLISQNNLNFFYIPIWKNDTSLLQWKYYQSERLVKKLNFDIFWVLKHLSMRPEFLLMQCFVVYLMQNFYSLFPSACFAMSLFIPSVVCDLQGTSNIGNFFLLMNSRDDSLNRLSYMS